MYLLTELILFIPFIFYACIRVRKLLPGSALKRSSIFFFVCLFLGYPIAEMISHREGGAWTKYVILTGYYCLPYLLYITFSVVLIDTALALAGAARILSRETVSRRGFRSARLACYLIFPALIVAVGAWNNSRLQVRTLFVELPQKTSTRGELRIAFASDFHLSQITRSNLVRRFVDKVNALNPDIVLIGGDVLEGDREERLNDFEAQFRKIRARLGVYVAPGNHERFQSGAADFFARCGMRFVEDGVVKIDNSFYLVVRKNSRFSRAPIAELLGQATESLPIIVLDHSPTDLENVSKTRADLQLSGHTHNGQLFPVNLVVMPFQYELAWGTMIKRHTVFIVSSGLQAWGPPVKTAGASEILSIRIKFRPAAQ